MAADPGVAVYVLQQGGSRVELREGRLRCVSTDGTCTEVPLERLGQLVLFDGTSIETDAVHAAVGAGVEVGFASSDGAVFAVVAPEVEAGDLQRLLDRRRLDDPWVKAYFRWLSAWVRERQLGLAARLDPATHRRWQAEGLNRKKWDAWTAALAQAHGLDLGDAGVQTARAYLGFLVKLQLERRLRLVGLRPRTRILRTPTGSGMLSEWLRPFRPWIFEQLLLAAGRKTPFRTSESPNGRPRLSRKAAGWWSRRYEEARALVDVELDLKLDEFCELVRAGVLQGMSAQKVGARSREQAGALRAV